MKGSILISGGNKEKRLKAVEEHQNTAHQTEQYVVTPLEGKKSIGIEQIRDAVKFLQKRPITGNIKTLIIIEADKLTIEAQNALLKTLEEPPVYATIVLESKTEQSLLPTVISRCQKVFCGQREGRGVTDGGGESLEKVKSLSLDSQLDWAQETAKEERDDIVRILEQWIEEERGKMPSNHVSAQNIRKIMEIRDDIENTNVNARLALETLLLNIL